MSIVDFWVATPCSPIGGFGGSYIFHRRSQMNHVEDYNGVRTRESQTSQTTLLQTGSQILSCRSKWFFVINRWAYILHASVKYWCLFGTRLRTHGLCLKSTEWNYASTFSVECRMPDFTKFDKVAQDLKYVTQGHTYGKVVNWSWSP